MIGDFLFRLQPQEAHSAPVMQRKLDRIVGVAALATNVNNDHEAVPLDKIAIVTNATITATAGAAQTVTDFRIQIRDVLNNIIGELLTKVPDHAAALFDGHTWVGKVILFPGEHLRMAADFSAAANANQVTSTVHSLYLPKGNLQLR